LLVIPITLLERMMAFVEDDGWRQVEKRNMYSRIGVSKAFLRIE